MPTLCPGFLDIWKLSFCNPFQIKNDNSFGVRISFKLCLHFYPLFSHFFLFYICDFSVCYVFNEVLDDWKIKNELTIY